MFYCRCGSANYHSHHQLHVHVNAKWNIFRTPLLPTLCISPCWIQCLCEVNRCHVSDWQQFTFSDMWDDVLDYYFPYMERCTVLHYIYMYILCTTVLCYPQAGWTMLAVLIKLSPYFQNVSYNNTHFAPSPYTYIRWEIYDPISCHAWKKWKSELLSHDYMYCP